MAGAGFAVLLSQVTIAGTPSRAKGQWVTDGGFVVRGVTASRVFGQRRPGTHQGISLAPRSHETHYRGIDAMQGGGNGHRRGPQQRCEWEACPAGAGTVAYQSPAAGSRRQVEGQQPKRSTPVVEKGKPLLTLAE
jgi:hypothetical protein